jgi:hypothetical protein
VVELGAVDHDPAEPWISDLHGHDLTSDRIVEGGKASRPTREPSRDDRADPLRLIFALAEEGDHLIATRSDGLYQLASLQELIL